MKIIVAFDSFKGSITAKEACQAAAKGLKKSIPGCEVISVPLADGGEGMIDTLQGCSVFSNASNITVEVMGPYGKPVTTSYLLCGRTAVIEMALVCGLELTPKNERNLFETTSFGLGEVFLHAIKNGCDHIIFGLGGSGTNDCGIGFAQAIGVDFYNFEGEKIQTPARASDLSLVRRVDVSNIFPQLMNTSVDICCDVNNPLLGKQGATMVYGKQKGANQEELVQIEKSISDYASIVEYSINMNLSNMSGTGAAGGMGAALMWFTNAKIRPGIKFILDLVGIDNELLDCDLVITGEGRIDEQTSFGKVPVGVAERAASKNIPVIAIAGTVDQPQSLAIPNINAIWSITFSPMSLAEAMSNGSILLESTTEQLGYTLQIGSIIHS